MKFIYAVALLVTGCAHFGRPRVLMIYDCNPRTMSVSFDGRNTSICSSERCETVSYPTLQTTIAQNGDTATVEFLGRNDEVVVRVQCVNKRKTRNDAYERP